MGVKNPTYIDWSTCFGKFYRLVSRFSSSSLIGTKKCCSCPLHNVPFETLQHIFLDGPFAKFIWRKANWPLNTFVFGTQLAH
jgi:hypothetical protein